MSLAQYAGDPHLISTVFENWESEFLEMSAYVVLTAFLFQKGSAESNDPQAPPRDNDLTVQGQKHNAPAPLRAGRLVRLLYSLAGHRTAAPLRTVLSFTLDVQSQRCRIRGCQPW